MDLMDSLAKTAQETAEGVGAFDILVWSKDTSETITLCHVYPIACLTTPPMSTDSNSHGAPPFFRESAPGKMNRSREACFVSLRDGRNVGNYPPMTARTIAITMRGLLL